MTIGKNGRAARARKVSALLASLALAVVTATGARAADASREAKGEFFLLGQYAGGDDVGYAPAAGAAELDFDASGSGGLGWGFNLSDHLNLNITVLAGEASADLVAGGVNLGPTEAFDDTLFVAPDFNVDWNLLDTPLTPFVTGGAGLMLFFDQADEVDFSYGAGAGVRWDFSDEGFAKVWYRAKWLDLDDTEDPLLLHTINVGIGFMR